MSEDLKKLILDFLQENGWKLRKNVPGLSNARVGEDPIRLILTVNNDIGKPVLNHNGVDIPVELEIQEVKPVIMVESKDGSGPEAESEVKQEKENDDVVHREFADQARAVFNISDALGPHVTEKDVNDIKSEAYDAWKKRHKNIKVVHNDKE